MLQAAIFQSERLRAIGLMCAAVSFFSLLDALAKYLATRTGLPVSQIIWVRFLGNLVLNVLMFGPVLAMALVRTPHRRMHGLRSLLMAATTGFNFLALYYLRLDQTVTIFFIAPFIVAALGGPLLGEWIGWRRLAVVMVGFAGILVVVRPGFGGIGFAVVYSLAAALTYALYNISTRYLAKIEPASLVQFGAPVVGAVLFAPPALIGWIWPGDWITWLLLVGLGFIGGFGHWLLVLAHRHAPAPVLAPFTYVGLPSMIVLEFFVFREQPDVWTLAGAAIIISAGIYLLWRERFG